MNQKLPFHFTYLIEVIKDGVVVDSEIVDNIVPTEGLNHVLNTVFKGGPQIASWYLGVFKGNYTPVPGDTAATLPGAAVESADYVGTNRIAFTPGIVAGGAVSNSTAVAEFSFTTEATIYGGFMTSAQARGATTGTLMSVVKFASAKAVDAGALLRVTAGVTLNSV